MWKWRVGNMIKPVPPGTGKSSDQRNWRKIKWHMQSCCPWDSGQTLGAGLQPSQTDLDLGFLLQFLFLCLHTHHFTVSSAQRNEAPSKDIHIYIHTYRISTSVCTLSSSYNAGAPWPGGMCCFPVISWPWTNLLPLSCQDRRAMTVDMCGAQSTSHTYCTSGLNSLIAKFRKQSNREEENAYDYVLFS